MRRNSLAGEGPVRRGRPFKLVLALAVTVTLGACGISAKQRSDWDTSLVTEDVAMVLPYVVDGGKSHYRSSHMPLTGYYGGGLAAVGISSLIGLALVAADTADKSDIGRHLSVFEIDGSDSSYAKQKLLLSPGRHRLGVKQCHEGTLQPACSRLVNLEFEAKGGVVYELVLLDGGAVLLRERESGLPAAWGDAEAATAEAFQMCVIAEEAKQKRGEGARKDESYLDADILEDVQGFCQAAHPASYQASLTS